MPVNDLIVYFTVIYYASKARDGNHTFFGQTTQNIYWDTTSTEMPIEMTSKHFSRLYNYNYISGLTTIAKTNNGFYLTRWQVGLIGAGPYGGA